MDLARRVLDRGLIDTSAVKVVRATDAYLLNGPHGWALAGIDMGLPSGGRLMGRRKACPLPDRVLDWTWSRAFGPGFTTATDW